MEVTLYDSTFCRLCGEENSSGVLLYSAGDSEVDLSVLVNRYLPFKIQDDGKLPRTICPGCNIQLQSTAQFFELLVEGQKKIRDMWKNQLEFQRKARARNESHGRESLLIASENNQTNLEGDPEEDQIVTIQIMADGGLFSSNHEIALKIDGLERPRRKRGRPPKRPVEIIEELDVESLLNIELKEEVPEEEEDEDVDGRKRRKRKVPLRYKEAVAGKELERIFREEGVIDDNEPDDDEEVEKVIVGEGDPEEVIGHLENHEGQDLGELVIANRGRGRGRPKGGKRRRIRFECDICGRGFQHKGRYILHRSYHKGVKYECTECNKQFSNKDNFYLHQKTVGHTGEGIVEGMADGEDVGQLKMTIRFPCEQCDKTFQTKQSHEVHMKAIHEGQKPYACEVCGKNFAYHNSLKFHMAVHEEQKLDKGYPCDICGKLLNHPSSVVYHKEAEHNNGRRFVCNKCGKGFKHKQLLQRHQLVHSNERPFVCKSCGASFKTKANLLNHQPTHTGEKKYFCEMCGQQFAHKTSLTLHYRWHTGQKPYECNVCQKTFSQNGNLQEHLRIHTGEKPFCCDYCGRSFTTSSQFKLHVKRHTGERPWKCNVCGKAFLHKDTWKCHVRRHNGEKPYTCDFCSRGFTEQWALKKHQRMHTGEKPYTCKVCGKAFADCSNLTKHKKVHRENNEGAPSNGYAVDRTVWNIIRSHLANEVVTGDIEPGETIPGEDGEGVQQIIYVTYQDPDHPNESRTLHIVEDVNAEGKHEVAHGSASDELILGDDSIDESDLQLKRLAQPSVIDTQTLQVTDEEGNPIHFTMTDGRELEVSITSSDGHSLQVTTMDGQTIPLQLMSSDGQPIPTEMEGQLPSVMNVVSKHDSQTQEHLEHSETNDLIAEEEAIEYTTENGQTVRIVTSYDVDSHLQLESEYLTQ